MQIPEGFDIERAFKDYLKKNHFEPALMHPTQYKETRRAFYGGWLFFFDAMYQNGEIETEDMESIVLDVRQQLETFFTSKQ